MRGAEAHRIPGLQEHLGLDEPGLRPSGKRDGRFPVAVTPRVPLRGDIVESVPVPGGGADKRHPGVPGRPVSQTVDPFPVGHGISLGNDGGDEHPVVLARRCLGMLNGIDEARRDTAHRRLRACEVRLVKQGPPQPDLGEADHSGLRGRRASGQIEGVGGVQRLGKPVRRGVKHLLRGERLAVRQPK